MQWKFTKIWLMVSGLLIQSVSFASTSSQSSNNKPTLLSSADEETNTRNLHSRVSALELRKGGLLNPPARPIVEDFDFNFFGDLLIWQAHENGLPIANKNKATNFSTFPGFANLQDSSVKHLDFKYDVGFRLGIDVDTVYDGWDVSLTWLRLTADAQQRALTTGNKELFASRLSPQAAPFAVGGTNPIPIPVYSNSHAHWKAFLNQLDWDLGREFFVSKHLTLRPHFGLRTTWIRQKLNTDYSNGITLAGFPVMPDTEVREKNKWWGLGVEGGLDTKWCLGSGFSLFGNLAAAIEYGFQKVRTKQEVEGLASEDFENNKDSYRISRPILDLQLGLQWDHQCCDGICHFGFHGGWEHHIYFSQNQFHTEQALGQFVANQGDLTYQGWTFGAHLAF